MEIKIIGLLLYMVLMVASINGLIMVAQIRRMREFNKKAEAMENLLRNIVVRRRK